jgi:hypothetical protein
MTGPRLSTDTDEAFMVIFEALNWAVVVDKHFADERGRGWARPFGKQDLIAGLRYARNAVHHDWADALEVTSGVLLPSPVPAPSFEWRWRRTLAATRQGGESQYRANLAEQPVRFTLRALDDLFIHTEAEG